MNGTITVREGVVELDQQAICQLANTLAAIIMPQIEEFVKGKAKWTVKELSAIAGQYLTVKEVAQLFRVSQKHVRNMIDDGTLKHMRIGQSIRIERSLVEQAIKDGRL